MFIHQRAGGFSPHTRDEPRANHMLRIARKFIIKNHSRRSETSPGRTLGKADGRAVRRKACVSSAFGARSLRPAHVVDEPSDQATNRPTDRSTETTLATHRSPQVSNGCDGSCFCLPFVVCPFVRRLLSSCGTRRHTMSVTVLSRRSPAAGAALHPALAQSVTEVTQSQRTSSSFAVVVCLSILYIQLPDWP